MSFRSDNVWLISDTHFNHKNILRFSDGEGRYFRGDLFSSVEEMNETLIENWNSVVKPGDRVYHLGDVFFGDRDHFKSMWPRLNGAKRLIVGNHDDIKWLSKGGFFGRVEMWRKIPEMGMILSHVPLHQSTLNKKTPLNVHGHIHEKLPPSLQHYNVSVERTSYSPVHIEDVRDNWKAGYYG